MAEQESVWDWFVTALAHDLAKTRLNKDGQWEKHNLLAYPLNPERYPFLSKFSFTFPPDLAERVKQQHEIQDNLTRNDPLALAVAIADGVQKAMHGMMDEKRNSLDHHPDLEIANKSFSFYPYYGRPITAQVKDKTVGYTENTAGQLFIDAHAELQKGSSLDHLMRVQDIYLRYPHTSYIPHLSLGLHQRLSAALFYFAYRELQRKALTDARKLDRLVFYLVEFRPDPLTLFYRMRDARVYDSTMRDFRAKLFEVLFAEFQNDLPEIRPYRNPFVFFNETAMVFLHDDGDRIHGALKMLHDSFVTDNFRALNVELSEYRVPLKWGKNKKGKDIVFANPKIDLKPSSTTLFPASALAFKLNSPERCRRCGLPIAADAAELLCESCADLVKTRGTATVWLDDVAQNERLGYLFLRLDEPLRDNAQASAEKLIDQFARDRNIAARGLLHATQTGLLEYLQAVMEVAELQKQILALGDFNPIVEFPELLLMVTRESVYYERIGEISALLKNLQLAHRLTGMLVARTTPFWSLMDDLATGKLTHEQRNEFYDFYGGETVMFSSQEIQDIRRLAGMLKPNAQIKNQLNILVTTAGNDSLDGLILQLDVRMNQNKIYPRFGNELRAALARMPGDDLSKRTKRALFIKNVIRLIGFQPQGQNQNRPPRPQGAPQRASQPR